MSDTRVGSVNEGMWWCEVHRSRAESPGLCQWARVDDRHKSDDFRQCRIVEARVEVTPAIVKDHVLIKREGLEWNRDDLNRVAWIISAVMGERIEGVVTWGDAMNVLNRLAEGTDPDRPHLPVGWSGDRVGDQ